MRILILGANGQIGWSLQRSLAPLGLLKACNRSEANLANMDELRKVLRAHGPEIVVNAAAFTAVDRAESEPELAKKINTEAVACLAEESERLDSLLIHYSTDYIFDGNKTSAYSETDCSNPLNVYGSTKWHGEEAIRKSGCKHFIFRTSWVYSTRSDNFIRKILRLAATRDELSVVSDQIGAPTHADLIADATAHCLHYFKRTNSTEQRELQGTYNLVAAGETNWNEYARFVLRLAEQHGVSLRLKPSDVKEVTSDDYPVPARRPKNSRLSCKKIEASFNLQMPHWRHHVQLAMRELIEQGAVA